MTKPLENLLRAAARSGNLNHLSIGYSGPGLWTVAYRGVSHADHRMVEGPDVVDAIIDALTGSKSAPEHNGQPVKVGSKPVRRRRSEAKPEPVAAPAQDDILGDLM